MDVWNTNVYRIYLISILIFQSILKSSATDVATVKWDLKTTACGWLGFDIQGKFRTSNVSCPNKIKHVQLHDGLVKLHNKTKQIDNIQGWAQGKENNPEVTI